MASINTLQRFREAMHIVYGTFDGLSMDEVATWTPPVAPGAGGHRGRYLWTDAFGVINLITLCKETSSKAYLELARRLVDAVHSILGRTRDGSARLPGASDSEPLKGGLRIGKADEAGRDGDGQYHHYLTLWMFALNRLALATGDMAYNELAIQLARAVHPHFVVRKEGKGEAAGQLKMVWKISMDMQRVLVPTQGHLDAATGYAVYRLLEETGYRAVLESEIADYRAMLNRPGALSLDRDLLDLGMNLWMCHFSSEPWARDLGEKALEMAPEVLESAASREPAQRLAFREFGLCLGVQCFGMDHADGDTGAKARLQADVEKVVNFWEQYLEDSTDEDLRPISLVMYAAALVPGAWRTGYLKALTKVGDYE